MIFSFSLSSTLRPARSYKPGQHMLHELHCPGTDAHPTPARLLPVRPTQMRDAEQLLFSVWNVAALPGGNSPFVQMGRRRRRRSVFFPLTHTFSSLVLLRPSVAPHPLPSSPSGVDPRPSPSGVRTAGCPRVPHCSAGCPAQTLQRLDTVINRTANTDRDEGESRKRTTEEALSWL